MALAGAMEGAVRVETAESALVQARRDAALLGARADKLLLEAEEQAQVRAWRGALGHPGPQLQGPCTHASIC